MQPQPQHPAQGLGLFGTSSKPALRGVFSQTISLKSLTQRFGGFCLARDPVLRRFSTNRQSEDSFWGKMLWAYLLISAYLLAVRAMAVKHICNSSCFCFLHSRNICITLVFPGKLGSMARHSQHHRMGQVERD